MSGDEKGSGHVGRRTLVLQLEYYMPETVIKSIVNHVSQQKIFSGPIYTIKRNKNTKSKNETQDKIKRHLV